jgi:hypothetical protein
MQKPECPGICGLCSVECELRKELGAVPTVPEIIVEDLLESDK